MEKGMMEGMVTIPKRNPRKFLPEDFKIKNWEVLEPYFEDLLEREIKNKEELYQWFLERSELEAVIAEDLAWRYINITRFTDNEEYATAYRHFVQQIQPKVAPVTDKLNKKIIRSPYLKELQKEPGFNILIRTLKKDIDLFKEENIPLLTDIQTETQKYGQVIGAMTIEIDEREMTLPQAAVILQDTDRQKREEVYRKISERRLQDKEKLEALFDNLVILRNKVAENAGFENFRDYMFKSLGRFDYEPQDCFDFHNSVKSEVVPVLNILAEERRRKLKLDKLRPWDKAVDPEGKPALKPFKTSEELTKRTIEAFSRLDPFLGECLSIMKEMGHLDLESRKGKAPGGYNYPLAETGVPFIFMNATSTLRDMVTILHEGGHAVHSFLTRELEISDFKSTPSEVAELASMSMELISMDEWDLFFDNEEDLRRAKKEHLEQIIETLPWVATVDKFQHWVYENPYHKQQERIEAWNRIFDDFADGIIDWSGHEETKNFLWHKQLHIYEVPFYYIEYGMAQLGAVAVWRNYKKDKRKGMEGYINALKLGYTRSIPEIYEAANIKFDFSREYIKQLINFVKEEINLL